LRQMCESQATGPIIPLWGPWVGGQMKDLASQEPLDRLSQVVGNDNVSDRSRRLAHIVTCRATSATSVAPYLRMEHRCCIPTRIAHVSEPRVGRRILAQVSASLRHIRCQKQLLSIPRTFCAASSDSSAPGPGGIIGGYARDSRSAFHAFPSVLLVLPPRYCTSCRCSSRWRKLYIMGADLHLDTSSLPSSPQSWISRVVGHHFF